MQTILIIIYILSVIGSYQWITYKSEYNESSGCTNIIVMFLPVANTVAALLFLFYKSIKDD